MYAVFKLSGFQYAVEEGEVLKVPRQIRGKGETFEITDVLMIRNGEDTLVGTPYLSNAKVQAEIMGEGKEDKVLVYKYKRRTKYRRRQGHRQDFTEIKINKIVAPEG